MNADRRTVEAQAGHAGRQHTDKTLAELGYDAPAIASLRERSIVA